MNFLCVNLRTFHLWGAPVFIMDDHGCFPNWIMILNSMFPSWMMTLLKDDTIFLSLGRRFSFLIVNRLIMDN